MSMLYLGPDPVPRRATHFAVPAGSCDTHAHVVGPHDRYPLSGTRQGIVPPEALLSDYMGMLDALGIARGVLVQPSAYGTDNTSLLDALAAYPDRLRGIAILEAHEMDHDHLMRLSEAGVRGLRFNTRGSSPTSAGSSAPVPLDAVLDAGPRLADAGLHAQFLMLIDRFPDADKQLKDYPVDIVIDHMGYPSPEAGVNSAGMNSLLRLLDTGRCWIKLSAPYRFSGQDVPYDDVAAIAQRLVQAAPERMLWASDWPHSASFPPNQQPKRTMPNDGTLLDLLETWAPDAATRQKILVDNPARLYGLNHGASA